MCGVLQVISERLSKEVGLVKKIVDVICASISALLGLIVGNTLIGIGMIISMNFGIFVSLLKMGKVKLQKAYYQAERIVAESCACGSFNLFSHREPKMPARQCSSA